jgi:hypothetical protein
LLFLIFKMCVGNNLIFFHKDKTVEIKYSNFYTPLPLGGGAGDGACYFT